MSPLVTTPDISAGVVTHLAYNVTSLFTSTLKSNGSPVHSALSYQPANKYPLLVGTVGYTSPLTLSISWLAIDPSAPFKLNETVLSNDGKIFTRKYSCSSVSGFKIL